MNEYLLTQLKIIVERAVRPVRASSSRKRKMREELLAHVVGVFEEESARLGDERAALEQAALRFGNPAEVTRQLQQSVPTLDSIERFDDWVSFRPCEYTWHRAVRYTVTVEMIALLFLFAVLILGGRLGEFPTDALWHTFAILFISGYLGFTICILESSISRILCERRRSSWLQFALVLVGLTIVEVILLILAHGFGPLTKVIKVTFFTVGCPVGLAWGLAIRFTSRKRYEEDWASVQIQCEPAGPEQRP
jgi:ATP-dependent Clp protease ATP-binding subunit ClpC